MQRARDASPTDERSELEPGRFGCNGRGRVGGSEPWAKAAFRCIQLGTEVSNGAFQLGDAGMVLREEPAERLVCACTGVRGELRAGSDEWAADVGEGAGGWDRWAVGRFVCGEEAVGRLGGAVGTGDEAGGAEWRMCGVGWAVWIRGSGDERLAGWAGNKAAGTFVARLRVGVGVVFEHGGGAVGSSAWDGGVCTARSEVRDDQRTLGGICTSKGGIWTLHCELVDHVADWNGCEHTEPAPGLRLTDRGSRAQVGLDECAAVDGAVGGGSDGLVDAGPAKCVAAWGARRLHKRVSVGRERR